MMATEIDLKFDVVVAGAGMIGCICAAAIAQSGIRVALIDPHLGGRRNGNVKYPCIVCPIIIGDR